MKFLLFQLWVAGAILNGYNFCIVSCLKSNPLNSKSTAKEVIDLFGKGKYLSGKVAVVTGGNSGIGLETCKALSMAGAKVILCSRSIAGGEKAVSDEIAQTGSGGYMGDPSHIIVKELDLNSLKSVKKFADDFLATESRLDLLVLNAGIMATPSLQRTEDGFEKQIGVNHMGHAYLTSLLKDVMTKQSLPSRIVTLSSTAHAFGGINIDDLHYKSGRMYTPWGSYGQSKLANLLFAKSLGDKLRGTSVTSLSVHPGVIRTNLWQNTPTTFAPLGWLADRLVMDKSIPQGAATTVWACVSPRAGEEDLRGAYLADCAPKLPNKLGQDADGKLREALWETTYKQLVEATAAF